MFLIKALAHLVSGDKINFRPRNSPGSDALPSIQPDDHSRAHSVTKVMDTISLSSDDENSVRSPRRTRKQSSSSSDSDWTDSQREDLESVLSSAERLPTHERHRAHKRPRLDPPPKTKLPKPGSGVLRPIANNAKVPQVQPRKHSEAKVTFSNSSDGDSRATLTFRNHKPSVRVTQDRKSHNRPSKPRRARIERDSLDQCPFYLDFVFELNMYRGPGYQKFPVALGTVDGHQDICDQWTENQTYLQARHDSIARRRKSIEPSLEKVRPDSDIEAKTNDSDSEQDDEDENACLEEVLQIFPTISYQFVREKYRERVQRYYRDDNRQVLEMPAIADIITDIAELDAFPKQAEKPKVECSVNESHDETGITIRWDKNVLKNKIYYKESIRLLAHKFSHIPTHFISKAIEERISLHDTLLYLVHTEENYYTVVTRPYSRTRQPRAQLEKKYQLSPHEWRDSEQYVQIVNEYQAACQHAERERIKLHNQQQKDADEAHNLQVHKAEGSLVECQCCFDEEIPINRAVSCEGDTIHFFCFGCVTQLAETQLGLMKYEMHCMDGSGCHAVLSVEGIGRAISIKTFDRLVLNQQQAEISAAGLEGLEQCPYCDFKAICEPLEIDTVFACQNPDCGQVSCRRCHEESHLPKTCEEVKKDKGISGRHLVEEARSEAMIRVCPKCKAKIVKDFGCNKMVCTCGCKMCYVCKKDISRGRDGGYDHFDQGPHHQGDGKCRLYDTEGADRHRDEADDAELEAIKKVKADHQDLDEDILRVETQKGDEGQRRQRRRGAEIGPGLMLHHPNLPQFGLPLLDNLGHLAPDRLVEAIDRILGQAGIPNPPMPQPIPPPPPGPMSADVGLHFAEQAQQHIHRLQQPHGDRRNVEEARWRFREWEHRRQEQLEQRQQVDRLRQAAEQQAERLRQVAEQQAQGERERHRQARHRGDDRRARRQDQNDANVAAWMAELYGPAGELADRALRNIHYHPPVGPVMPVAGAGLPRQPAGVIGVGPVDNFFAGNGEARGRFGFPDRAALDQALQQRRPHRNGR